MRWVRFHDAMVDRCSNCWPVLRSVYTGISTSADNILVARIPPDLCPDTRGLLYLGRNGVPD
jgi:hypothetical protein